MSDEALRAQLHAVRSAIDRRLPALRDACQRILAGTGRRTLEAGLADVERWNADDRLRNMPGHADGWQAGSDYLAILDDLAAELSVIYGEFHDAERALWFVTILFDHQLAGMGATVTPLFGDA